MSKRKEIQQQTDDFIAGGGVISVAVYEKPTAKSIKRTYNPKKTYEYQFNDSTPAESEEN